ncbi:MAG: flagellar hook-associated protein FlgK [Planctomycetota bacterium]|nr:MAG: flagellar hook-associated protein FlgK [Planctomycetota bacterium]
MAALRSVRRLPPPSIFAVEFGREGGKERIMSINGALNIGHSAIQVSQAALQIAGNNLANASTPGYHRQIARISPARPEYIGRAGFVGTGVSVTSISRAVDSALQARLRSAISQENSAAIDQRFLNSIETIRNELTDQDLSSRLGAFFNSFSELSNNPNDEAVRTVVIQQASGLATSIRQLRNEHVVVREEIDRALDATVDQANGLLDQIAGLNAQIVNIEQGSGSSANSLRDRRDQLVDELSEFIDCHQVEQANGSVDILVGSIPIVLAGGSRGLELRADASGGTLDLSLRVRADGTFLAPEEGQLGALFRQRTETVAPAIAELDNLAGQLAYQVNRVHSQGQGRIGWTSVVGMQSVADPNANLGADAAEIPFAIKNGSFELSVRDNQSGLRTTVLIAVDPQTMTLTELAAAINAAVPAGTASATVTTDGRLQMDAGSGYTMHFSNDSSGALASLGINALFGGSDAASIEVNEAILGNPQLLAAGSNHVDGSNGTALAIAALQDVSIAELGSRTLRGYWQSATTALAVRTDASNTKAETARVVREGLDGQAQALSGVSIDEESINLLMFQRQYQAAAKYISIIDETLKTLLAI